MFKTIFCALFLLLTDVNAAHAVTADKPDNKPDVYLLRQGDKILISVWREETLQREVVVLPDGSVTFPLVGRVEVTGLSTPEVEQNITAKLKKYLSAPIVSVTIVGLEGHRAYVTGKVVHPGSLIINGPVTVLQAISIAGGFDKFADEGSIKLIREKPNKQEVLPVNYEAIISGKDVSTNVLLKAGDTVVVP